MSARAKSFLLQQYTKLCCVLKIEDPSHIFLFLLIMEEEAYICDVRLDCLRGVPYSQTHS